MYKKKRKARQCYYFARPQGGTLFWEQAVQIFMLIFAYTCAYAFVCVEGRDMLFDIFLDGGGIEGVIDLILDRPPFCRVPGVRDVLWSG